MLRFKELTTQTKTLSNCFKSDLSIEMKTEKWMKTLKSFVAKSFKKIRLKKNENKRETEENKLLRQRTEAIRKGDANEQEELEETIKEKEADRNIRLIKSQIDEIKKNLRIVHYPTSDTT